MKKIALMFVAAAAIFAAVPASAQTVVIRDGMHGDRGMHRHGNAMRSRAEWRHRDRGHHHHGMRHRSHRSGIVITR